MKEKIIMSLIEKSVKMSHEINADLIILFTDNIQFGKILSNLRPNCIIACPTTSIILSRFLRLFRGVIPFYYEQLNCTQKVIDKLIDRFREKNIINKNIKTILIRAFLNNEQNKKLENKNYNNGVFILNFD